MQQRHIINRQIVEVKLPKTVDSFAVQNQLSAISREQLTPIIDAILSKRFGGDGTEHVQLDRLVIDLGTVQQEDLVAVFAKKFDEVMIEKQAQIESETVRSEPDSYRDQKHQENAKRISKTKSTQTSDHSKEVNVDENESSEVKNSVRFQKTPLRILAHYVSSGILPWWAAESTKSYLSDQLDALLKNSDPSFIKLLAQLRFNSAHLERFIHTFSEDQIISSLQLLTSTSLQSLKDAQKKLKSLIKEKKDQMPSEISQLPPEISESTLKMIFWKSAFHQLPSATNIQSLKNECTKQTLSELAIDEKGSAIVNEQLKSVQSLVKKYSTQYVSDTIWQQFFKHVERIVNHSSFNRVKSNLLIECKRLLVFLELTRENSGKEISSEVILRPFAEHLQLIQNSVSSVKQDREPLVIDQLTSQFEETDFITVENAGLVLFWPFLIRFFQNLGLIEENGFKDEFARNKAICALQYLCGEEDTELFEGSLSLNKLLCDASLEEVVAPVSLSDDEKEMVENLLQVVIQRGPHWENLSVAGLRSSYLLRQGSLRMRDGHWLLQVQKETHDITMERLPWSISTVKLPWMDKIILVEWM